ncbi:hypothetical protein [Flavobacterium alkalisoli]|uniref:hypothetical protein n=1 Tax=Flavobacterium alkalisoli TaxID=2602769 RepID=UPI003A93E8E6
MSEEMTMEQVEQAMNAEVIEDTAETGVTPDSDMFGSDDGFMGGLDDIMDGVPEEIEFTQNEKVVGTITDVKETKSKDLMLDITITEGEHAGKITQTFIKKPNKDSHVNQKRDFMSFLLAFFTKEEIKTGQGNIESIVGKTVSTTVKVREYNGNNIFDFKNWKIVTDEATADSNPFA